MRAPRPRDTTNGSPPTPPNARTGELTPPGKSSRARAISARERMVERTSLTAVMARNGASLIPQERAQRASVGTHYPFRVASFGGVKVGPDSRDARAG